jgi:hypothetical protein
MLFAVAHDALTIVIEKQAPQLSSVFFDSSASSPPQVGPDASARTHWQFNCQTEADYQIISKHRTSSGWNVELKITAIKLKLTMPIVIYLPRDASDGLKSHESGHVEICRRIYERAQSIAGLEARRVLRTFQGNGRDIKEACDDAIRVANIELIEAYGEHSVEVVNNVSVIYDFLETSPTVQPGHSVDEAFRRHRRGGSRRL